jgi:hypothetical protein
MTSLSLACSEGWSSHRPSREFAPAGDLLFGRPKSRQKVAPAKPPTRVRAGPLRCSKPGAAPNSLRYAPLRQRGAKSDVEARCARAPGSCASRRFRRGVKEQPNSPATKPASRSQRGISFPPSEPAEERKGLRPCAQRTSSSDVAQLSERSVAKRVPREASRPVYRRAPRATRGAGGSGALSLPTFLCAQESRSPAGAKSLHGTCHQTSASK